MKNKLIKANQDKIQSFTKLLREKLMNDGCHRTYVNALSEQQILKDFRICADCDEVICTADQQIHTILEFDTAERAFDILYGDMEDPEELEYLADDYCRDPDLDLSPAFDPDFEDSSIFDEDLENIDDNDDNDATDEDIEVIRGRWTLDGCTSLAEAIDSAKCFLEHLEALQDEGYELIDPVEDDCGYLKRHDET